MFDREDSGLVCFSWLPELYSTSVINVGLNVNSNFPILYFQEKSLAVNEVVLMKLGET